VNQRLLARAMPWVFVLIWSTGFVVARLGMPHAPPLRFLSTRYALSIVCFLIWIAASRAPWPRSRSEWLHLAVVGVLLQAGYLGGVWSAVKAGMGAGTAALLVGLQPVLTALWVTAHTPSNTESGAGRDGRQASARITARQWLGLLLGLAGLVLVVWRKLGTGEMTAFGFSMAMSPCFDHRRHALPEALRPPSDVHRGHGADARRARRHAAAGALRAGDVMDPEHRRSPGRCSASRSAAARCCTC
jgi:drug/metabolite transporter (DMT)-like permease